MEKASVTTVALLLPLLTGCGYTLGYRAPPGVATVAVPTFDNQTFPLRREIEYELTAALRREIQTRTGLVLVDQKDGPDMAVFGTLKHFRERVVAEGRLDEKTESTIFLNVELVIEDYRNRTVRRQQVEDSEPVTIQEGETIEDARARAVASLAGRMVTAVEHWGP
jgi:hypothetical protein